MKQYLWAGVAVLLVNAHASENPFDLKENFGKLDQDQAVLLDDLKKLAELKEIAEEKALDEADVEEEVLEIQEEIVPPALDPEISEPLIEVAEDTPLDVEKLVGDLVDDSEVEKVEIAAEVPTEKVIKEVMKKEEAPLNVEKLVGDLVEPAAESKQEDLALNKAEEARKALEAKNEAERREVEAYEKQRAEKLAQEKLDEPVIVEKIAEVKDTAEVMNTDDKVEIIKVEEVKPQEAKSELEIAAAEMGVPDEVVKQAAKEEVEAKEAAAAKMEEEKAKVALVPEVKVDVASMVADINVTRDKIEEKITADKAYEAAVKEMSQED